MGQDGREWSNAWARRIGENVAMLRKEAGISAQRLSELCGELGYPIPRSTIANIESGRKRDIPVQEVAVIARAMKVPPIRVLYEITSPSVEIVPGVNRSAFEAAEWFSGNWPIMADPGLNRYMTPDEFFNDVEGTEREFLKGLAPLFYYREHARILDRLFGYGIRQGEIDVALDVLDGGEQPKTLNTRGKTRDQLQRDREYYAGMLQNSADQLRDFRSRIAAAGYNLPPLAYEKPDAS